MFRQASVDWLIGFVVGCYDTANSTDPTLVTNTLSQMEPVLNQIEALMDHRRYNEIFALCTLLKMDQVCKSIISKGRLVE